MTVDPKALRGLLEKATAGPWYSTKPNEFGEAEIMSPVGDSRNEDEDWVIASTAGFDCDDEGPANAELIPAMRNALPDLLDAYEERDRLKFQQRVKPWLDACFGPEISNDKIERNHRFLEEALELVQACGCTQSEARQLVDYVYGRPEGEIHQEVGGVMVTLAAHCLAHGIDMHDAGETELARIWTKVEKIREKQANKPKHSPLPEALEPKQ